MRDKYTIIIPLMREVSADNVNVARTALMKEVSNIKSDSAFNRFDIDEDRIRIRIPNEDS